MKSGDSCVSSSTSSGSPSSRVRTQSRSSGRSIVDLERARRRRRRSASVIACPLVVAVVVVGELQQFEWVDAAVVLAQRGELQALAAQLVGVDADPAMAGVEQRGARFGGAGQFGLGDRLVADDELPVDECLVTELLLAVVGRRGRRLPG